MTQLCYINLQKVQKNDSKMNIIPRFPALVHVSRKTTQNVTCNGVYMIYETLSMWHHVSDTRFKKKKKKSEI